MSRFFFALILTFVLICSLRFTLLSAHIFGHVYFVSIIQQSGQWVNFSGVSGFLSTLSVRRATIAVPGVDAPRFLSTLSVRRATTKAVKYYSSFDYLDYTTKYDACLLFNTFLV